MSMSRGEKLWEWWREEGRGVKKVKDKREK
jgi:hypothetical protein